MAIGIHNHPATSTYVPISTALNRSGADDTTAAQKFRANQNSYGETGNAGPNAGPGYENRAVTVAQGLDPAVNDATKEAPDAASIAGVSTYNYRGQLNAAHSEPGRTLKATA